MHIRLVRQNPTVSNDRYYIYMILTGMGSKPNFFISYPDPVYYFRLRAYLAEERLAGKNIFDNEFS